MEKQRGIERQRESNIKTEIKRGRKKEQYKHRKREKER